MNKPNQLPENLPYLQNLIKRDFDAYHAEFLQQYRRYESNLQVFLLQPSENSKVLSELIIFVAQVSHCYPGDVKNFPQQLRDVLQTHGTLLNPDIRMTICRALMLLKKKNLVAPMSLYELFFGLFRCQDKRLRELLSTYITKDVRHLNRKNKNNTLNKSMQNNMYTLLSGNDSTVVRLSLKVMIELYQRKVWNDSKTVNIVSTACFSKFPKVLAIALKFFLGNDRAVVEDSDSEDDLPTARDLMVRYQTSRKNTRRKIRQKKKLRRIKKKERKSAKKKENKANVDFSAIHQLVDPDGFADKLYQRLQKSTNTFEVRLMMIMVLGRVIGVHSLFLFNFYPFLQRFLQPHQREVTKILMALAQASHELVPPEILKDSIMTIANNFVTDRNSGEVMAVGINSIREICSRCPLAMSEDLLQDLTSYQHKHGKSVLAAARSLVALYRRVNPKMLRKRDRGKFTQATKEIALPAYGEVVTQDFIPGSEILPNLTTDLELDNNGDGWEICSEDSDSDGSWINVSSDEELEAMITAESRKETSDNEEEEKEEELTEEEKLAKSKELSLNRIFTPADFNLISAHQERKQVMPASVKTAKKRKRVTFAEECTEGGDVVPLNSIEDVVMKKKRDKETRLAEAMASKADRTKKSGHKKLDPYASTTNRIKLKRKPFMMVRPKMMQKKTKKSFQEKQVALRNSLLKKSKKYKIR